MLSHLRTKYWFTGATSAVWIIKTDCCFFRRHNSRSTGQKKPLISNHIVLTNEKPALLSGLFEPNDLYDLFNTYHISSGSNGSITIYLCWRKGTDGTKNENMLKKKWSSSWTPLLWEALGSLERSRRLSVIRKDLFTRHGCRQNQMSFSAFGCCKALPTAWSCCLAS